MERFLGQWKISSEFGLKWVFACVYLNYFNLLKVIENLEYFPNIFDSEELVILAVRFADVPIIDFVLKHYTQQSKKQITDLKLTLECSRNDEGSEDIHLNILEIAVLRGNYLVMEYLLKTHEFEKSLLEADAWKLVVYCVYDTKTKHEQIQDRKHIIEKLYSLNPNFSWNMEENFPMPFQVPNIHLDLILHLINLGADVYSSDENYENILHYCPAYMTPKEYDTFVRTLYNRGDSLLLISPSKCNTFPLHVAVRRIEVFESTVEIFLATKADFNFINVHGDTCFHSAIINNRSAFVLDLLVRAGFDITRRAQHNSNCLHLAAEVGNLTATRYLLSRGISVNSTDMGNQTPLYRALLFSTSSTHGVVKELIRGGADVNAVTDNRWSILAIALDRNKQEKLENRTVEFLRKSGSNLVRRQLRPDSPVSNPLTL
ncbi:unnamed protein product [Orchesella dallaii]|uniref:Ankyrin repeat protein n=1 Tax=Orchesella dallaii TaxID=48710 RepID=A0ABP1RJH1_9HEXA